MRPSSRCSPTRCSGRAGSWSWARIRRWPPIILGVVLPLVGRRSDARRSRIASAMAIVSGTVCILAGIFRLGFITELLSKPIRYGYMNGIALARPDQPVAQAVRLLDRERGPAARPVARSAKAILAGKANWVARRARRRHPGRHPAAQAVQAHPERPDRGRSARRSLAGWLRSGRNRRRQGARPGPAGPARASPFPWLTPERHRPGPDRRLRRRHRLVRRHQRPVAHLCGAHRHPRRSQPGDGRARRRQSRRRLLPGLPDQQQLVANPGRRSRRRPDPADRRRRRARRRAAAGRRADAVPASALRGACGGGDRRGDRPVRIRRPAAASTASSSGNSGCRSSAPSASPCSAPSRASAWRSSSPSSNSCGTAGGRIRRCSATPTASKAITTSPAIPMRAAIPGLVLFRWDAPLFFANAELFNDRVLRCDRGVADAGTAGGGGGRADHQRRRHRVGRPRRARRRSSRQTASSLASPR